MIAFVRRWPRATVFAAALVWIFALEERYRPEAHEHLYFQAWTSEYMMQTVSVGDLRHEPWKSLWYNHIQPPVFDTIRAMLAAFHPRANAEALMRRVDGGLYAIWMIVYATMAVTFFSWLRRLRGTKIAAVSTAAFLILPGPIFYAAFLDTTLLSSALILWFLWNLWRLGEGDAVTGPLVASAIVLFFTRSVFQWPFLVVLAVSLWLMNVPRVRLLKIVTPVGAVMLLFLAKQYLLFGLTTTSSFGPDSFCKGLSEYCHGNTPVVLPKFTDRYNALVLRRAEKLNGEYNYNQEAFLKRSFSQMAEYKALLRRLTFRRAFELLRINLDFYLRPTSRHSSHVIVDQLPWRSPVETLLSGWRFVALLAIAVGFWAARNLGPGITDGRRRFLHACGLALPVLYVAAVTVIFESGENMRYRFFLEPSFLVFIVASLSAAPRPLASTVLEGSQS